MGELDDEVRRQRQARHLGQLWGSSVAVGNDPLVMQPVGRVQRLVNELILKIDSWDRVFVVTDPQGNTRAIDNPEIDNRLERFGIPKRDRIRTKAVFQSQRSWKRQLEDEDKRRAELVRATLLRGGATEVPGMWIRSFSGSGHAMDEFRLLFSSCVFPDGLVAPKHEIGIFRTPAELEAKANDVARCFTDWLRSSQA